MIKEIKRILRNYVAPILLGTTLFVQGCDIQEKERKEMIKGTPVQQEIYANMQKRFDGKFAKSEEPIVLTVAEEKIGTVSVKEYKSVRTTGYHHGVFGSSPVVTSASVPIEKAKLAYTIVGETDEGKPLSVSVKSRGNSTKEALEGLVKVGSRISFPRGNWIKGGDPKHESYWLSNVTKWNNDLRPHGYDLENETYFDEDTQFGSKFADRITVLPAP